MGRRCIWLIAVAMSGLGCATAGTPGVNEGKTEDVDRWETVMFKAYEYPETCGAGPWEVTFPAREVRWGRQIVVQVRGPRAVPVAWEIAVQRPDREWTMRRRYKANPEPHRACRVEGGGESTAAAKPNVADGLNVDGGGAGAAGGGAHGDAGARVGAEERAGTQWQLLRTQPVKRRSRLTMGYAFYPKGRPMREDDFATDRVRLDRVHSEREWDASGEVTIRVWLSEPSDLRDVQFMFRDQDLVPDRSRISIAEYKRTFAQRVDAYAAVRDERQQETDERDAQRERELEALCAREPNHYKCKKGTFEPPPDPIAEERPPAPPNADGVIVRWVPGYWRFDESAEGEYVWVSGTYKVEAKGRSDQASAPKPTPEDGATTQVAADVPPMPSPRDEAVPAPPAIDGVIWVAGRHVLKGNAWVWIPGRWQVPPKRGARRTKPRVEVRGRVKIYVPGGWVIGR